MPSICATVSWFTALGHIDERVRYTDPAAIVLGLNPFPSFLAFCEIALARDWRLSKDAFSLILFQSTELAIS